MVAAALLLIVATALPGGSVYVFYHKNAWAEDVARAQEEHKRQANIVILQGQLDVAKVEVAVYLVIRETRTLTELEQLELEGAQEKRRIAAEALADARQISQ